MYKSKFKNVVLLCLLAVSIEVIAGKPFRPSPLVLIDEATIIVKGDVLDIYPSLMKNHLGNPLGVAKVRVNETYKGIVPNNIYVVTNYDKKYTIKSKTTTNSVDQFPDVQGAPLCIQRVNESNMQ